MSFWSIVLHMLEIAGVVICGVWAVVFAMVFGGWLGFSAKHPEDPE
jgi:hypothetical protein